MSRFLHRWIATVVVLQIFIWVSTGLYFNLVNNQWHDSNSYYISLPEPKCANNFVDLNEITELQDAVKVELLATTAGCFYLAHFNQTFHQYQLMQALAFDATTGAIVEPLDSESAREIALASYTGPGKVVSIQKHLGGDSSNGKQLNSVWQVNFDDERHTRVYVHDVTRKVIRHENRNSRFHQLMFKLHFMDYFNTGGFNHALLIVMAMLTCLAFMTGIIWLVDKIRNGQLLR